MRFSAMTDIGRMREQNQDAIFASSDSVGLLSNLFIVADGMGGYKAGDYASKRAIELVQNSILQGSDSSVARVISEAMETANKSIYEEAKASEDKTGMGTTMVLATIEENLLQVANVGDSRLYLYRDGQLLQVTKDHSIVAEMVRKGELTPDEAKVHPKRSYITRAIGAEESLLVDFMEETVLEKDLLLLCSDGVTSMLSDEEIAGILSSDLPLEKRNLQLIEAANELSLIHI